MQYRFPGFNEAGATMAPETGDVWSDTTGNKVLQ